MSMSIFTAVFPQLGKKSTRIFVSSVPPNSNIGGERKRERKLLAKNEEGDLLGPTKRHDRDEPAC